MTGKTQMPSAESPTHPQGQAKPMIGEMAQRYPRNLRVYIGYTRPQGKQGLNGHVWDWGKTLCSLACLSLELLNLHVIFWEQEGSGPACLSSPVASQPISSCLELPLFSSDVGPHPLFFKCLHPDLPNTADRLLFLSELLIFPLFSSFHPRSSQAPVLNSAFLFMP